MTSSPDLPPDLVSALEAFSRNGSVLVALDFDGVLSEIVEEPSAARPVPGAADAVRRLVASPGTAVAAVSGRALDDLRAVSGLSAPVLLVGSHGAEREGGAGSGSGSGSGSAGSGGVLDEAAAERLELVRDGLDRIRAEHPGTHVEVKPTAAVLHTRRAARDVAASATQAALEGPGAVEGVHVTPGKEVVEIAVTETGKDVAVEDLRRLTGADAVLYCGDDVTDENAFAVLREGDVGVKVGDGETRAAHRLGSPADVVRLLEHLATLRT